IYLNTDVSAKLNYLMLPVLAKVGWNLGPKNENHFRFYADAGPFVGYLVSAHQDFSDTKNGLYKTEDAEEPITLNGIPLEDLMNQFDIDLAEEVNGSKDIRSELNHWNVGISDRLGFHITSRGAASLLKEAVTMASSISRRTLKMEKTTQGPAQSISATP